MNIVAFNESKQKTASDSRVGVDIALRMLQVFATLTPAVALPNLPGYTEYPHINCFHDHGAINIDSGTNASTKTLAAMCRVLRRDSELPLRRTPQK